MLDLGAGLLDDPGLAAWEGRVVDGRGGPRWLNDTAAELRFRTRLKRLLTTAPGDSAEPADSTDPPTAQPAPVEPPV